MYKESWGEKRICPMCSKQYYDLGRSELECPECGKEIEVTTMSRPRRGRKPGSTNAAPLVNPIPTKPKDKDDAIRQLKLLRGKAHFLATSVCVVKNSVCLWSYTISPRLEMRLFTKELLDSYLESAGDEIYGCVGGYQLEGAGIQLFESIDGDYFSILGLPLLPLLQFLRLRGTIEE